MTLATFDASTAFTSTFRVADLARMTADEAMYALLSRAAELRASDLFLLSDERYTTVAVRRLGTIERLAVLSTAVGRQVMSHVKAFAAMDISEKRRPADGRWLVEVGRRRLDLRINFTPTLHGEDLTIRICDREQGLYRIEELGLSRTELQRLLQMLKRPSGLLLVTGPIGAGKTTTMYACLQYLNDGSRKINTLEDPVEYALEGVRQSQVNPRLGLDFPELLRNVLRQAADVIMIGEIRDAETMATAVRAAGSGQLVLAALHGPAAATSIASMLALGANPYFLSGCLLGIVSQRLVRTLCPVCRLPQDIHESPLALEEVSGLFHPAQERVVYGAGGCEKCYHCGYAGRTGLFEIMVVNDEIRRLIAQSSASYDIHQAAMRAGMVDLRKAALLKVAQGITSPESVLFDIAADTFVGNGTAGATS